MGQQQAAAIESERFQALVETSESVSEWVDLADIAHWRLLEWLERCDELGYDLSVPIEMTNFFFCPTQSTAHELAESLSGLGHRIIERGEFRISESGDFWVVKSQIVIRMQVESMEAMIDACMAAAVLLNATYDGWEVDAP